jgi:chemotaxis protein histidine kinase CheA
MSDSDIVQDFLVESYENLDRLDRDLVGLEKNPQDRDALAGVFRTIHTIKGTCGFLGFNKLEKVAHVGENLLTRLRDGQLTLNPEITTALLGMVDAVRQMLKEIGSTGQDGDADYPELRETLTRLQAPASVSVLKETPTTPSEPMLPTATEQRKKNDDSLHKPSRGMSRNTGIAGVLAKFSWPRGWPKRKTCWRPSKLWKLSRATRRRKPFASESLCWTS